MAIEPSSMPTWAFPEAHASSPAIGADGTVYIIDDEGILYAIR